MSQSFGLDAKSALAALEDAIERFKEDELNRDLARECATKAWHFCDHVFNEHAERFPFAGLGDFQEHVRSACPELEHLQVICNASKHGDRLRRTGQVKEARRHGGAFSRDFSREFGVSRLVIELTDGTTVDFEDALDRAIAFWFDFVFEYGLR